VATFLEVRFIRAVADEKAPAKKASAPAKPLTAPSKKASPVVTAVRWLRAIALAGGLVVSLLGVSAALGVVTDMLVLRAIVALVLLVGLPLFVSDKILSRMKSPTDRLGVVLDVFGVLWVGLAWLFVAAVPKVLVAEGDRQTRQGALWLAKTAYFLGGVSPTFREQRAVVAPPSASASASAAPSASAPGAH